MSTSLADIQDLLSQGADESLLTPEESEIAATLQAPPDVNWDANLAELMDESALDGLADTVIRDFDADEESRKDWLNREALGIRLLGVSDNTEGGAEFAGACRVVHPGLSEAIVQFQARAMAEIWPPQGPAKAMVLGDTNAELQAQAQRAEDYLNYLYTEEMPGAFEAQDALLFRLPLSGSVFKKIYYCPIKRKLVSRFIAPGMIVVPYRAEDILTTPRITHVIEMTHNDLLRMQKSRVYRKAKFDRDGNIVSELEIAEPMDETSVIDQTLRKEEDSASGESKASSSSLTAYNKHVILEQMTYLDLKGYEDRDETGKLTGIGLPYIVSVEQASRQVLSIRRNWDQTDDRHEPIQNYTHYKFLPGFGFYGFGLLHIAGFLSRGQTGALRAILDYSAFANAPGGLRSRDVQVDLAKPISPGEWRAVQATAEDLSKAFFPLPYKDPSMLPLELLKYLDELMRRLVGTTEDLVGDNAKNVPVGTTLARIEQGLKPQVAIHRRLHNSMSAELKIVARLCAKYLPPEYPYLVTGQDKSVKATDFDERIDIVPVSDPNVVSATQRIVMAQGIVEMAQNAPDVVDRKAAYERLLQAMRAPNPEELMVSKEPPPHTDPVGENMLLQTSQPVKAYQDQNHAAHIEVHQAYFATLPPDQQKGVGAGFLAHIAEHMAMDYYLAVMAALNNQVQVQNPLMGQAQPLPPEFENQVAVMAAQVAQQVQTPSHAAMVAQAAQAGPPGQGGNGNGQDTGQMGKDAALLADIQRKDMLAASQSQRDDAEAMARMTRANAEQELDLIRRYLSQEAEAAIQAGQPQPGVRSTQTKQ